MTHLVPLTSQQVEAIVKVCLAAVGPRGSRDAALIALIWCAKLSVPQAIRLSAEAASRAVLACGGVWNDAVIAWSGSRPTVDGPFLLSIDRREAVVAEPMRATTAAEVIRRRAAEAKAGYITPQELLRASVLASGVEVNNGSNNVRPGPWSVT